MNNTNASIDVGKQFRNIGTDDLYVLEGIDRVHIESFTDLHDVYIVRNTETDNVSRWEQTLFWKYFRFEN